VAHGEEERRAAERAVATQAAAGLRAEMLDARAAREVEPELSPDMACAVHYPDEAQVDPPALLRALVAAVGRAKRIELRAGTTVKGLLVEKGSCVGVALDAGALRADATLLAAGSWSSLVPGLPAGLPEVRPARGQIVELEERPPRLRTIVVGRGAYAVPRGDGRVLCGSTMELVGFRKEVTAAGVHAILGSVLALVPSLGPLAIASMWSNFRPRAEPEQTPLVGASPMPGLFLATGHFRNGILLAKVTADAVAGAVLS
jgi:glycine oxidase